MIAWNITKLMSKDQDKAKEATRKQRLKDLGGEIFKQDPDASHVFVDASFIKLFSCGIIL